MLVSDVIADVRVNYLSDVFDGWESASQQEKDDQFLWLDSQLIQFVNDAVNEAIYRTNVINDSFSETISYSSGTSTYALSDQLIQVEALELADGSQLIHRTRDLIRKDFPDWKNASSAAPEYFFIRGHELTLYPAPDASADLEILGKAFVDVPPVLISTDTIPLNSRYHKDVKWFVLSQCYLKQDADVGADETDKEVKALSSFYLGKFDEAFGAYVDERKVASLLEIPLSGSYSGDTDAANASSVANLVRVIREDYLPDYYKGFELADADSMVTNKEFSDAQLVRFIEKAQIEACFRDELLVDDFEQTVVVDGSTSYELDKDIVQVDFVRVDGEPLIHKHKSEMDEDYPGWRTATALTGTPVAFYMKGSTIVLHPRPEVADITSGSFVVEGKAYFPQQESLVLADTLTIPYRFINDLHLYVLYLCNSAQNIKLDSDMSSFVKEQSDQYLARYEVAFGTRLDPRLVKSRLESRTDASFDGSLSSPDNVGNLVRVIKKDYLPLLVKDLALTDKDDVKIQSTFTDSQLVRFIEKAQIEACFRDELLVDDFEQTVVVDGSTSYQLDKDLVQVDFVRVDGEPLIHKHKSEMDEDYPGWQVATALTGTPIAFCMKGTTVVLHPRPEVADATEFVVEGKAYFPQQEGLTVADTLTIPYRFINDLHLYVLYLCSRTMKNVKFSAEMTNLIQSQSDQYLASYEAVFGTRLDPRLVKSRLESRTDASFDGSPPNSTTFGSLVKVLKKDYLPLIITSIDTASKEEVKEQVTFTDSSLLRYLNEAHLQACLRSDCVINDTDFGFSTRLGKVSYEIEQLISQLNHVTVAGPDGLVTLTKEDRSSMEGDHPDFRTATGVPTHYYMKGYTMSFYPIPDASYKITLECNSYPERMMLGSEPIIPLAQRHHLIWYALSQLSMKHKDFKTADYYESKFVSAFGVEVSNAVIMDQLEHKQSGGYLGPVDYLGGACSSSSSRSRNERMW